MSQLIQLRNRIKAIETIKKITHAMRLISMSAHTRLRSKDEAFNYYTKSMQSITQLLLKVTPEWRHARFTPDQSQSARNVVILIGSQRGLCGNFNTSLFYFFDHTINPLDSIIIPVGKKAVSYCATRDNYNVALEIPELAFSEVSTIAERITNYIMKTPENISSVSVVSNKLKSFFTQKPQLTHLIPVPLQENELSSESLHDYVWEQDLPELINYFMIQTLKTHIEYLIFQSLIAEQAARFISMDNATRNAQGLLDTTKLSYNKLRQAKITKELTELSGTL